MKLFFNSILLLSLFVSIGTGTTSVWHCLKNDTLLLGLNCKEVVVKSEKKHCCAKETSTDKAFKSICCEELEQAKLAPFTSHSELQFKSTHLVILAFNHFDDLDQHSLLRYKYPHSKAPPPHLKSPPLFKLHCSFLC